MTLHPGARVEEVRAKSAFEIQVPEQVLFTLPPTLKEKCLLHEIDPLAIAIGGWMLASST
jgi:hypothetical protein